MNLLSDIEVLSEAEDEVFSFEIVSLRIKTLSLFLFLIFDLNWTKLLKFFKLLLCQYDFFLDIKAKLLHIFTIRLHEEAKSVFDLC